ncbi:MAG: hypothetical protein Q4P33_06715 [Flaviflexus sp.]|nr:hypothetical protein [Flaviflexus sp.]
MVRIKTLAAAAAGLLTLSSCALTTEVTTQKPYAPSDGIRVELDNGTVVENLFFLVGTEGGDAHVQGLLNNRSQEQREVTLAVADMGNLEFSLEPDSHNNLTDSNMTMPGDFTAGENVSVTVSSGEYSFDARVPVISACTKGYEDAWPEPLDCPEPEAPAHGDEHEGH